MATMYEGPPPSGKPGPTGLPRAKPGGKQQPRTSPQFVVVGVLVIAGLGLYLFLNNGNPPPLTAASSSPHGASESAKQYLQLPAAVRERLGGLLGAPANLKARAGEQKTGSSGAAPLTEKPFDPYSDTTVLLKNGERVTGKLLRQTPEEVVLRWDYGQASFKRSEIRQVIPPLSQSPPTQAKPSFLPGDSLTLTLKSGERLTGELVQELPDELVMRFDFGEVNFKKSEISRVEAASL